MNANELMIGDLVMLDGEVIRVEQIYEHSGYYRINNDNFLIRYIKPIPLTEEILKANEHKRVGVSKFGFPNIVIDTPKCYILKDFSYVHELQHALRLCGLNELSDNFKVSPN